MASRELSSIALRLLHTTATSVPAERAFSALNRQLTKFRNSMTPESVNKIVAIYLNNRALRDAAEKLEDTMEMMEEDRLMAIWGQGRQELEEQC